MGPIMQERTASTTLKRVASKEKIRVKNAENTGPVTSSKKSNKVKRGGGQVKNGLLGSDQDKDTEPTGQRGSQSRGGRVKSGTTRITTKLSSPKEEGALKSQLWKHTSTQRKEEKQEIQRMSPCYSDLDQNRVGMGQNRRDLSLPLSTIAGQSQVPTHPQIQSQGPMPDTLQQHYHQREDDTDSASDLSDSERLPILPSPCTPCTPPHLNLRAEVINTDDFPLEFPGPHGTLSDVDESEKPGYSYPDFLPPPFNSWSLRQLAVFLHTEGRGAPRPKPVGPLEKYLERLLQLEWLQIQTRQAESSRLPGSRPRPQSFPSATTVHTPRPHTAPPTRLNSPKGLRQSPRAFPFTPVNNPLSPAAAQQQPSRFPVCPHCHIRYPLCNGSCSAYAYQRHSRLSPLMERKARPGAPVKRSSSESRATTSEGRATGGQAGIGSGIQIPVSPSAGKSHLRHMQAAGNVRKPLLEPGGSANSKGQGRKGRIRANSETDVKKEPNGAKPASTEKQVYSGSKRELSGSKRVEREWQRTEAGGQVSKTSIKKAAKDPQSLSKAPLGSKKNGKAKNVHFVAK